jgi:hypothetical protein
LFSAQGTGGFYKRWQVFWFHLLVIASCIFCFKMQLRLGRKKRRTKKEESIKKHNKEREGRKDTNCNQLHTRILEKIMKTDQVSNMLV